jgi:DNA-directed RNA polymerase subunit RPC12/RpoP
MSVSCVGTCSNCGARRFWLSDTLSLQLDDGRLKCLPHPAESGYCEKEGLTLAQASERARLYRETFYVCRTCGRDGETIEKEVARDWDPFTTSVRGAMKWGWGSAVVVVPCLIWMRWWQGAEVIGGTMLLWPGVCWWENRKIAKASAARGLPRADAPGLFPIGKPIGGCCAETVIGQPLPSEAGATRATGPCCDKPDWIEAFGVKDENRVPCPTCRMGVMVVSEHAIH